VSADPARAWRCGLPAVLILAVATRAALILATPHSALFGDPVDYQRWAVSLVTGHGFPTTTIASPGTPSAFRPPAYPLALAGLYAVTGVHVLAARALGVLLGVAAVGLLAVLARQIVGTRVGLIAGTIAAVFPPLVALSGTLLSEALFVPLELAVALVFVQLSRRPGQLRWAVLAGVVCALAILTRTVADLWIVVALVMVLAAGHGRTRGIAALIVAFAIVLAPWTIRNLDTFHAFVPVTTEAGYTLAGQYNSTVAAPGPLQSVWQIPTIVPSIAARLQSLDKRPGGVNEVQLDSALRSLARSYIVDHPGHVATAIADDTLRMVNLGPGHGLQTTITDRELALPPELRAAASISGQVLVALAILGLTVGLWRRRPGPWWLWALPVTAWLVTAPAVGNELKRAPLDPFLMLLAAVAVEAALGSAQTLRARGR
jgi:4-amino-4-deoxy-L-arabinose transferase-like glycosyltransferase